MGGPAKDGWALAQLARTGDDATARRLVPVITAWPGRNRHAMADKGVDVLVALGSDTALHAVRTIAATAKERRAAGRRGGPVAAAAAARGFDPGRLA
ncbi:hypothetical protein, partial [Actinomadura sp. CNU-125]|uniref:hypothetical protein n=1 Tax=Actinomadura sp. CNU-125 TaxID=1904961 RepID=UPI0011785D93